MDSLPTKHIMIVLVTTLCSLCAAFLFVVVVYFCWTRYRNNEQRKRFVYCSISSHGDEEFAKQEKLHILQPSPRMETVPFEVPGSMSTRGWSSGVTPAGSLSSLATASVTSHSSFGSTETLIRVDPDQMESPWTILSRGNRSQDVTCLGSIDPSLYKQHDADDDYEIPDYHIGRIWFRVQYERETEKLLVTLIKARNLLSRSLTHGNICDPFVRLYLLPDERRYLQSKCKKKTCNPNYNEDFIFQIPLRMFSERVLKFTIFDVHKRQRIVGHATYPLQDHNPEESVYVWRDLERELTETTLGRGEIKVSLTYNPHYERITVGVYEGRNLKPVVDRTLPDFYIRVCLLIQSRVTKTKRTAVIRQTSNPVFNESFNFKLTQNQLDSASVSINSMQLYGATKDKCSGRVVLGSFMFARGKELDHWNEMINNKLQRVSRWHALT